MCGCIREIHSKGQRCRYIGVLRGGFSVDLERNSVFLFWANILILER